MHLSLKGSMDRQPLTDRLGDKLLAEYGGAAAAYSLRSLSGDQTKVVRVRRSSDNAEKDFTASEMGAALEDWVGALNDGFVETWYDQSGNGNDATQTVAANQPKIVDAGAYLGEIDFDGDDDVLDIASIFTLGLSGSNDKSIFSVVKTDAGTDGFIFAGTPSAGGGNLQALRYRSSNTSGLARVELQGFGFEGSDISDGNQHLFSSIFSGTQTQDFDLSVDGLITQGSGTGTVNTLSSHTLSIGHLSSFSSNAGTISELLIYASDQSANREAIEANINNHYSIY